MNAHSHQNNEYIFLVVYIPTYYLKSWPTLTVCDAFVIKVEQLKNWQPGYLDKKKENYQDTKNAL